jgi:hypothetical protein
LAKAGGHERRGRWSLYTFSPKTIRSPCLLYRRLKTSKRPVDSLQRDLKCQESGRRDSNPRQPAWKAGTYKNIVRLSYFSQRSQFIQQLKKVCSKEAGTYRFHSAFEPSVRQEPTTFEEIIAYYSIMIIWKASMKIKS